MILKTHAHFVNMEHTTIRISRRLKQRLDMLKVSKCESYESVIQRLIDEHEKRSLSMYDIEPYEYEPAQSSLGYDRFHEFDYRGI